MPWTVMLSRRKMSETPIVVTLKTPALNLLQISRKVRKERVWAGE